MLQVSNYSLTGYSLLLLGLLNCNIASSNVKPDKSVNQKAEDKSVEVVEKPQPKIKFSKITDSEKKSDIDGFESVNDKDLEALSRIFVNSLTKKNKTQFYESLDKDVIVSKSLAGAIQELGDLSIERQKIIRGIVSLPSILISKIGARGHIKFLRIIKRKNSNRGLVRIKFDNDELSYLELIAQKDKEGNSKIIDFYDPMVGRNYISIVSQMLISSKADTSNPDKILYFTKKPLTFHQRYRKTIRFYKNGDLNDALESFQHLPIKFQSTRDMMLLRVQISKAINTNAYREALVLLHSKFSEAPDLALLFADHYYFTKQLPLALKSIEKFSDYIGGDVALDSLRVKLHISKNSFKQAITIGRTAINEDNSYEELYWLMLKAYLHSYQYQHVGETLDVLLDKFGAEFDIESFYKDPFYREYAFSRQFNKWKIDRDVRTSSARKESEDK